MADDLSEWYNEVKRRGLFKSDSDLQAWGHELRARGLVKDATQGGLVTSAPALATSGRLHSQTPKSEVQLVSPASDKRFQRLKVGPQVPIPPPRVSNEQAKRQMSDFLDKMYQPEAMNASVLGGLVDQEKLAKEKGFVAGAKRGVIGLTTPANLGLMVATGGLPALGQKLLLGAMAAQSAPGLIKRFREGDPGGAFGEGAVMFGPLAAHGLIKARAGKAAKPVPVERPLKPTIRPDAEVSAKPTKPAAKGLLLAKPKPGVMAEPKPLPEVPTSPKLRPQQKAVVETPKPLPIAKKGEALSAEYVYHNTSPEAIAAIEKEGMEGGSFSDRPIKFGQKAWIAVRKSDLPGPVREHSYGVARAHEPQWEKGIDETGAPILNRVSPDKIYLVNSNGKVIRSLAPKQKPAPAPTMAQETPKPLPPELMALEAQIQAQRAQRAQPQVQEPAIVSTPQKPKDYIIREEPNPLAKKQSVYRVYEADGTPIYIGEKTPEAAESALRQTKNVGNVRIEKQTQPSAKIGQPAAKVESVETVLKVVEPPQVQEQVTQPLPIKAQAKTVEDILQNLPPATEENYAPRYMNLLDDFYDKKGNRKPLKLVGAKYNSASMKAVLPYVQAHSTLPAAKQAMLDAARLADAQDKYAYLQEVKNLSPEEKADFDKAMIAGATKYLTNPLEPAATATEPSVPKGKAVKAQKPAVTPAEPAPSVSPEPQQVQAVPTEYRMNPVTGEVYNRPRTTPPAETPERAAMEADLAAKETAKRIADTEYSKASTTVNRSKYTSKNYPGFVAARSEAKAKAQQAKAEHQTALENWQRARQEDYVESGDTILSMTAEAVLNGKVERSGTGRVFVPGLADAIRQKMIEAGTEPGPRLDSFAEGEANNYVDSVREGRAQPYKVAEYHVNSINTESLRSKINALPSLMDAESKQFNHRAYQAKTPEERAAILNEAQAISTQRVNAANQLPETITPTPEESASVLAAAKKERVQKDTGLTPTQEQYLSGKLQQIGASLAGGKVEIPIPGDGKFSVSTPQQANQMHLNVTGQNIPGYGELTQQMKTPAPQVGYQAQGGGWAKENLEAAKAANLGKEPAEPPSWAKSRLEAKAQEIQARLKSRKRGLQTGIDPEDLRDLAQLGAIRIAQGVVSFADFSKAMIAEAGEAIRPHLQQLYDAALAHYHNDFAPRFGLPKIEPGRSAVTEEPKNAVQIEKPDAGLLRQERPQVGLQRVGQRNTRQKAVAGEGEGQPATPAEEVRPVPATKPPKVAKPTEEGKPSAEAQPFTRFRHVDIEAAMQQMGLPLSEKIREAWRPNFEKAAANYEEGVKALEAYDPAVHGTLTRVEQATAVLRMNELSEKANPLLDKKTRTKQEDVELGHYMAEVKRLGNLTYRQGSEVARDFAFRKALIPADVTNPASVLTRAEAMTDGQLSETGRRSLVRLSQEAKQAQEAATQEVQARTRARTVQNKAAQGVPAFTREGWGAKNTATTRTDAEAARQALLKTFSKAGALPDFPSALPHLVTLGKFHFEAGAKAFADWRAAMHHDTDNKLDEAELRAVWQKVAGARGRFLTQEQVQSRVQERLSTLGADRSKPKTINPLLDEATIEYAKGAVNLDTFARRMRERMEARYGDKVDPKVVQKLFQEAAVQYQKDYKQLEDIKNRMGRVMAAEAFKAKPGWQRAALRSGQGLSVQRAMQFGHDLSFFGRQGLFANALRPIQSLKTLPEGFKAYATEEGYRAAEAKTRATPEAEKFVESGGHLSDLDHPDILQHEEMVGTSVLPGIRERLNETKGTARAVLTPIRALVGSAVGSERGNTALLNRMRVDMFGTLTKRAEFVQKRLGGKGELSEKEYQAIADFVNNATGRGNLGKTFESGVGLANALLTAPRFYASRVRLLAGTGVTHGGGSAATRIAIASSYAQTAGAIVTILAAMKAAGAQVDTDPDSTTFLRVKVGHQNFDAAAGLAQYATFLHRWATGRTVSGAGKERLLDTGKFGEPTTKDLLSDFVIGKAAPLPSAILEGAQVLHARQQGRESEDFEGKPITPTSILTNRAMPLGVKDAKDALEADGVPASAAAAIASFLGIGAQTYTPKTPKPKRGGLMSSPAEKAQRRIESRMKRLLQPK